MTATLAASATPVMDRLISRTVEKHRPLSVHFDLTYRCNERCVHCYLDHDDHGEMTTAECLKVLDDLARSGALFLTFSGGEIFLRPDLYEILAAARRLHFDISLKSNALLVTPERAARLREFGVRRVQISVYSDIPAVHDAITKVPGSLQRTLAAIPILLEHGMQVKLACPLMQENLMAYRGVMALAEKLGVPYILDLTITPMIDGSSGPLAHRASVSSLLPVLRDPALHACKPQPSAQAASAMNALPPSFGSAVSSGIESLAYEDLPCSAGHNSCYISPYGDVFPCVQLPQAAGNLRREKFEDIWYHAPQLERLRAIRESQLPICSRCEIRSYCERCPGLALMEGGDLLGAYERACALAEEKARLAGVAAPISAFHVEQNTTLVQTTPEAEYASLATDSGSD
ncbi:MAG TPA: radical SAM protein [Candidatus Acidoferrum sp.]|nr:radical SAM protein [Candidatus Acidoferrum sp.]